MSHIATAELSDDMEVTLNSDELVIADQPHVHPRETIIMNKQEALKLKDFLNREV